MSAPLSPSQPFVEAWSDPLPTERLRSAVNSLIRATRARRDDTIGNDDDRTFASVRRSLPCLDAVTYLQRVSLSREYEPSVDRGLADALRYVELVRHDNDSGFSVDLALSENDEWFDVRVSSDMHITFGYKPLHATATECVWQIGVSIGSRSKAASTRRNKPGGDDEALMLLYGRLFRIMGLDDQLGFERRGQQIKIVAKGELKITEMEWSLAGYLTGSFRIAPFRDLDDILPRIEAVLESPLARRVMGVSTHSNLPPTTYERLRDRLNSFAVGWDFWCVGRWRPGVDPYTDPRSLPPSAPRWIPLLCWSRRRHIEKRPYEVLNLCSMLRDRDGLRLELTSSDDKLARLLALVERSTGLRFTLQWPVPTHGS